MSVTQAFDKFDKNKDGTLSKKEMTMALRDLGISNLSEHEIQ
jgi:Ca2+-binding EF-hand superfamily protein